MKFILKITLLFVFLFSSVSASQELIVMTKTGKEKNAGTDGLKVFLRINGGERVHLDNKDKNDLEANAEDVFRVKTDVSPRRMKTISLEVEGDDAWLLDGISFQVVGVDYKSKIVKYNRKKWLSGEKESVRSYDELKFRVERKF